MNQSEKKQEELALLIKLFSDNMPAHLEVARLQAKLAAHKYSALIEEGFTEEQALTLCSKI